MPDNIKTQQEIWEEAQMALTAWGKLLIASGELIKPEKCFYYLIVYVWNKNVSLAYAEMNPTDTLCVTQSSGHSIPIEQTPVDVSKLTLGVWTNPLGDCSNQLMVIHNKIEVWTNRLTAGKLPANWAWISYFYQLCPQMHWS